MNPIVGNSYKSFPSDTPRVDAFYAGEKESDDSRFARNLERELAAVTAERDALATALAPFADYARLISEGFKDESIRLGYKDAFVTVGDLRNARAAVEALKAKHHAQPQ